MYSDLFDHLGTTGSAGAGNSTNNEVLLRQFKAGKMELQLQENGHYWASPDSRRGEVRLVWNTTDRALQWQWYDRREQSIADRHVLFTASSSTSPKLGKFERVENAPNAAEQDRLYVWTRPGVSDTAPPEYHMYWMQDANAEHDDDHVAKINQYLKDPASANPNRSSSAASGGGTRADSTSSTSNDRQQVDALSNILENLGMPQGAEGGTSATAAAATAGAGTLTLADLQGAMEGIQTGAASAGGGPPLQEVVTPAAISKLLEDDSVKQRLLQFLPEEQRSLEHLEGNLRSPQVQQTLRSLTAALLPDDTGSMDGYFSVLANFNLDGAQEALIANNNNSLQAFLECVLKSVEKEKGDDKKEEGKDEETKE